MCVRIIFIYAICDRTRSLSFALPNGKPDTAAHLSHIINTYGIIRYHRTNALPIHAHTHSQRQPSARTCNTHHSQYHSHSSMCMCVQFQFVAYYSRCRISNNPFSYSIKQLFPVTVFEMIGFHDTGCILFCY